MQNRPGLVLLLIILRPADQSVLKPGPFSVIAKTEAELKLDGKPLAVTRPAPGIATATINPAPGLHEISAAEERVKFFVGAGAPPGWKEFRAHPPAASCESCHAIVKGAWEFAGNCFQCHDQKAFPKIHQHNTEVLADCQLCHYPHGSTERRHLKMQKETACKQCHG